LNKLLYRSIAYLRYRLQAKTRFSAHSPFLYEFIEDVLLDKQYYPAYQEIDSFREQLKHDRTWFKKTDYGALGQQGQSINQVNHEAEKTIIPEKYGRLLYRLLRYKGYRYALEMGTGFGISTAYLARGLNGDDRNKLVTMEGCTETLRIARHHLDALAYGDNSIVFKFIEGPFDENLDEALNCLPRVDVALLDGNHQKTPLLRYFEHILPFMNSDGVIIVDDIYWSQDMQKAWQEIICHSSVTLSLNIYRMGLVFLAPGLSREQFKLRF